MIEFDKDKVLLLQQLLIESTGGTVGVRDFGLLDSALASAFQTFDGVDLYPTKEEKAARLGFNLVSNHAFLDGFVPFWSFVTSTAVFFSSIVIPPSLNLFILY